LSCREIGSGSKMADNIESTGSSMESWCATFTFPDWVSWNAAVAFASRSRRTCPAGAVAAVEVVGVVAVAVAVVVAAAAAGGAVLLTASLIGRRASMAAWCVWAPPE